MTSSVHSFSNKTEMLGSLLGSWLVLYWSLSWQGALAPGGELQETPGLWQTAVRRHH
jgi:hypothetical protein